MQLLVKCSIKYCLNQHVKWHYSPYSHFGVLVANAKIFEPPSYDVATELPSYEEAERTKLEEEEQRQQEQTTTVEVDSTSVCITVSYHSDNVEPENTVQ